MREWGEGGLSDLAEEQERLALNKQTVRAFYDLVFKQTRATEATACYASDTTSQPNPHVGDGKDAFSLPSSASRSLMKMPSSCIS